MDEEDIVAIGGELTPKNLLHAYRNGVFPWPDPSFPEVIWACPMERAILRLDKFKPPKSLSKAMKKASHFCTIDRDFSNVIRRCAEAPRQGQSGTWITPEMLRAYEKFHKLGYAHSIEVWSESDKTLIGGLYGVEVDGIFAGESMFHLKPNASKFALIFLVDHLKKQGVEWIDIQMLTPHMKAVGAEMIKRPDFLSLLVRTRSQSLYQNDQKAQKIRWSLST